MTTTPILVLHPHCTYAEVERAFCAEGWRGGPVTALAPLVAAEPELAIWRRDGAVVRYEFDPTVRLRVVTAPADVTLPDLPLLDGSLLAALAASPVLDDRRLAALAIARCADSRGATS